MSNESRIQVSTVQDEEGRFDLFYENTQGKPVSLGRIFGWATAQKIARFLNEEAAKSRQQA